MVALQGDMLRRFHEVDIWLLIWSVDCQQSALLVIVSAEAVCTQGFLEYYHILVNKQKLDRIVINKVILLLQLVTTSYAWPNWAGMFSRLGHRRSG
jgi:hypothetical protein